MRFTLGKSRSSLEWGDVPEEAHRTYPIIIKNSEGRIAIAVQVVGGFESEGYIPFELAELLVGDICDFLNDKYCDKEINAEWPEINPEERIKYHEEQIEILKSSKYVWNEHGTGVENP